MKHTVNAPHDETSQPPCKEKQMKNLLTIATVALMLIVPVSASAGDDDAPAVVSSPWALEITNQQLTAARSTGCIDVARKKWLYARGEITRGGTITSIKASCVTYRGSDCSGIAAQALLCVDNVCALWEPTLAGIASNTALRARFDVAGDDRAICTFTPVSGGTASDLLNAYVRTVRE